MMHHFIACTMFNVTTRYIAENISCAKILHKNIFCYNNITENHAGGRCNDYRD